MRAKRTLHGHAPGDGKPSRTYNSWVCMRSRCHSPKSDKYYAYGARGISVCDRWRESFTNFLEDMGERPEGKTLDRVDPGGNYEPGNCRWATPLEQSSHIRRKRTVRFRGQDYRLSDLARLLGLSDRTLTARLRYGWSDEQLALPLRRGRAP